MVQLVTEADVRKLFKKDGWRFNWKQEYREPSRQIYKLLTDGSEEIQGLISLKPMKNDRYIEMHLIENAPHNYGNTKRYLGVAGNLVAFACKMSFVYLELLNLLLENFGAYDKHAKNRNCFEQKHDDENSYWVNRFRTYRSLAFNLSTCNWQSFI
jgi:hypothetical protein